MIEGTVQVPSGYFQKMAVVDYSNWRTALAREFFQNSIDAHSKNVNVVFNDNKITIQDDGSGMSLQTITDKLLVLGGSEKDTGAVGAFGKAKELLYFSWKDWSIRTRDMIVIGHGPNFTIDNTIDSIKGTISTITVDKELFESGVYSAFENVAKLMDTPTKIFIDGLECSCSNHRGRLIKSFDFGDLYLNKSINSVYMEVKISGIWMHSHYLGTNSGQFVLELSKSSIDCLTSNRDDLKWQYRNDLSVFVRNLIANEKSVTSPKDNQIRTVIPGQGKVKIRPELIENIIHSGLSVAAMKTSLMEHIEKLDQDLRVFKARMNMEKTVDVERWQFLGYKPEFKLSYTKRQTSAVKRFMNKKKALKLANLWTEILKQVLLDIRDGYMEFTAGFTFDSETAAEIEKDSDGNVAFYLNPLLIGEDGGWNKKALTNRYLLVEDLKYKAIHEVAHISHNDHNENFVIAMNKIKAKTDLNHRLYEKIGKR